MTDHPFPLLSPEEEAMLAGECGPGVQRAMEIIVALGRIYRARHLLPVTSVQVAGVSYSNLGEAGLEFLSEWATQGARVRVPTMLNPAGMDLLAWRELGFTASFADRQLAVIEAFRALGVRTTCTCTPYLVGNVPGLGEHVAWAESSAVAYANSVLGARTNREGGPSALAAAIAGRTPAYGFHLEANRHATLQVWVRCPVRTLSDFGALGYLVGKRARNGVPCFFGLEDVSDAALKSLGAAMAAAGAVALYHVAGITPESGRPDLLSPECEKFVVDDLGAAYAALNSEAHRIDLVWFGCPHADLEEIREVTRALGGRRIRSRLWITAAREVRERAAQEGLTEALESVGGRIVSDMCVAIAPMRELGFRTLATPSAKGAVYASSLAGLQVRYGAVEQCIEAAITGRWPG